MIKVLEHFHKCLYGGIFRLQTDTLIAFVTFKNSERNHNGGWRDYRAKTLKYIAGEPTNANAVSRKPCKKDCRHRGNKKA